jgi:hypothetical protein
MARPQVPDGGDGLQIQQTRGGPPDWGAAQGTNNFLAYEMLHRPWDLWPVAGPFESGHETFGKSLTSLATISFYFMVIVSSLQHLGSLSVRKSLDVGTHVSQCCSQSISVCRGHFRMAQWTLASSSLGGRGQAAATELLYHATFTKSDLMGDIAVCKHVAASVQSRNFVTL